MSKNGEKNGEKNEKSIIWGAQVSPSLDALVDSVVELDFHRTKSEFIREVAKKEAIEHAKRILKNKSAFIQIHPDKKDKINFLEKLINVLEKEEKEE